MSKIPFILRMPDRPGELHKAAEAIKKHKGNILRVSYDRNIDTETVFFEVSASPSDEERIKEELLSAGYLQTSLKARNQLKLRISLPNRTGALHDFLDGIKEYRPNVAFLDFDEKTHDKLTITLNLEDAGMISRLLDAIKDSYRIEVLEYDASGTQLDDSVYYFRLAQEIREIVGEASEAFLLKLLHDINHITQELTREGLRPEKVFGSILATGRTLKTTSGEGFYADIQRIELKNDAVLYCIQPPAGGNIYVIDSPKESVLIDTGYGIYGKDIREMLRKYMRIPQEKIKRIYLTHADADHAGASGEFNPKARVYAHSGTKEIIERENRAHGSKKAGDVLPGVYTELINLFSRFSPAKEFILFNSGKKKMRGAFRVLEETGIAGIEFKILEGFGGHLHGQIFICSDDPPMLFSGDSLINLGSLSPERKRFNLLAKNLMSSVNVDSEKAERERRGLLDLAKETGTGTLICGGHGAVSILRNGRLEQCGETEVYKPQ